MLEKNVLRIEETSYFKNGEKCPKQKRVLRSIHIQKKGINNFTIL